MDDNEGIVRVFYEGKEISYEEGLILETGGKAHVVRGASATIPERLGGGTDAWMELDPGPSNLYLERQAAEDA